MQHLTIAQIRALSGTISDPLFYTIDDGKEGVWRYDPTDSLSWDNTGMVLVTADGKRIKRKIDGSINVKWFGAIGDGQVASATADNDAIKEAVKFIVDNADHFDKEERASLYFPQGTYQVSETIDANSGIAFLRMHGAHKDLSIIKTNQNISLIKIRDEAIIENLTLHQTAVVGINTLWQGKAIDAPHSAHRSQLRSLVVTGFKYGFHAHKTCWLNFEDVHFKDNEIGVHLGYDQSYAGTWNVNWFNNVIVFSNVIAEIGEKGFDLYAMGVTLLNCTTQALSVGVSIKKPIQDPLPPQIGIKNNLILNHYAENVPNVIYLKDCEKTSIIGLFAQGQTAAIDETHPKFNCLIEAENSYITVESATGMGKWHNDVILHGDSVCDGQVVAEEGMTTTDEASLHKGKYSFTMNHLVNDNNFYPILASGNAPPLFLVKGHTYRITITGLRNGTDPCVSEYILYYYDNTKFFLKPITVKLLETTVVRFPDAPATLVGYTLEFKLGTTIGSSGMSHAWAHIEIL